MGVPHVDPRPMTAEEFFAFTATRPDGEKWELIDGEPVLNEAVTFLHQRILGNVLVAATRVERERQTNWEAVPSFGARVSAHDICVPDVLIRPNDSLAGVECDDMIVAFEVLSPSTADHDLRWKRRAYATLASLQHYVVVAQDAVEVVVYDRQTGFGERRIEGTKATLDLPALGISVPLAEIYRDTGLDRDQ